MSVDTYDCEPWDVYPTESERRARKDHVCHCCAETIRRGDLYHYEFAVFEGRPEHLLKRHSGMEDAAVDRELKCGHSYKEVFGEEPTNEIAALAFALPGEL